jgi:hypothetical protein
MRNPIFKWGLILWPERILRVLVGVLIGLAMFAAVKAISTYDRYQSVKAQKESIKKGERPSERANEQ